MRINVSLVLGLLLFSTPIVIAAYVEDIKILDHDTSLEIRGGFGFCHFDTTVECETGGGCSGVECGEGQDQRPCSKSGQGVLDNPAPDPLSIEPQFPTMYTDCFNEPAGLETCGFPSSPAHCGSIEVCQAMCVGGHHLGSGFDDHKQYCKSISDSPNNVQRSLAQGGLCQP